LILSGGATAAALTAGAAFPLRCNGKFYPGAAIAGVPVGGLTREEARAAIQTRVDGFTRSAVTYVYQNRTWHFSADELGVSIDIDAAIEQAWAYGRDEGLTDRYEALLDRRNFAQPLITRVDSARLDAALADVAGDIHLEPVDATFGMAGTEITITPERTGRTLDVTAAREQTLKGMVDLEPITVMLRVSIDPAAVTAEDLEPSRAEAARLISGGVTLRYRDDTWEVDRDALARSIMIPADIVNARPELDPATLAIILQPIADELYRAPVNAEIGWNNGVYAVSESRAGRAIDVQALAERVIEAAGEDGDREVEIPAQKLVPEIDSENLDALGIVGLMAEGASSYAGSATERAINVEVSAEKVNHAVIPPGGSLSFLDAVGKISVDAGFVEGKIIADGWYASDIGGGVCQVSTTVYRAALLAGLPFAEWHPHGFRVGFYELDGWPAGMDAAIYQPNNDGEWALDLIVTNPTDAWILLQMTTADQVVTASLYGPDTGYQVELSDVELSNPTEPSAPLERKSADLPAGERQQTQQAQPGITATLVRRVMQDGELVSEDTFVSVYAPVADAFVVGTGS
jgi:vancomycin resistance protein YoaR